MDTNIISMSMMIDNNSSMEVVSDVNHEDEDPSNGGTVMGDDLAHENDCNSEGGDVLRSLAGETSLKWETLYSLYESHAKAMSFGIRLGTCRRKCPGAPEHERYFNYSSQGLTSSSKKAMAAPEDDLDPNNTILVSTTRTKCKAEVRTKLINGEWVVFHHIIEHNHPLTPPQWQHHHRSERRISAVEGEVIEIMTGACMPPSVQYRYISAAAGGEDLVGHTKKDHFNFVNRLKMKRIEGGDAASLIHLLSKRQAEDPGFFYRIKFGKDGRLSNVFWSDSMMKEDYLLYNDVIMFDTTYRTNRYNLICGAFVGINNHWLNVMFGCAFLSDEKIESFQWLFQTFKECMGGDILPTSIFTDQDLPMSNAIDKEFSTSRHRLCQWHIQQNAMSHFGSLKHDSSFQNVFNKCLRGCYNEAEFEATWTKMISDYGLENDEWFARLYGLKEKWCTALSKDFFSVGILSSQRSESTNHAIGFRASKTTSLTEFYGIYEETVKRWRNTEEQNEFNSIRATPKSHYPMVGLLQHVSQIYTLKLFRAFERELEEAIGTVAKLCAADGSFRVYDVHPEGRSKDVHQVTFDHDMLLIDCSCHNFQETGWLCFHSIRVLHLHSITEIPERYISRRWTKFAKTKVWNRLLPHDKSRARKNDIVTWRRGTLTTFYSLIMKCQDVPEAREILDKLISRGVTDVQDFFKQRESEHQTVSNIEPPTCVLDPVRCTTKGRSQRKKRQTSKSEKRTKVQHEVVPYTPIPRLF